MLNPNQKYSRKDQIVYDESGTPIIKFIGITRNATGLTGNLVENMNNYIRCYPDRVELIITKKENVQLNLF